jgi:hypothetical protein
MAEKFTKVATSLKWVPGEPTGKCQAAFPSKDTQRMPRKATHGRCWTEHCRTRHCKSRELTEQGTALDMCTEWAWLLKTLQEPGTKEVTHTMQPAQKSTEENPFLVDIPLLPLLTRINIVLSDKTKIFYYYWTDNERWIWSWWLINWWLEKSN